MRGQIPLFEDPFLLTEMEKVWLACAIDCEGHISFFEVKGRTKPYTRVVLGVTNTSPAFLLRLKDLLPIGRIERLKALPTTRTPCYKFMIKGQAKVLSVLQAVEPYLVIKRDKANLAIEFLQSRLKWSKVGDRNRAYTKYEEGLREKAEALREAHIIILGGTRRGVAP
jgi:hypothetical protein